MQILSWWMKAVSWNLPAVAGRAITVLPFAAAEAAFASAKSAFLLAAAAAKSRSFLRSAALPSSQRLYAFPSYTSLLAEPVAIISVRENSLPQQRAA
jgi:hypothetical protein